MAKMFLECYGQLIPEQIDQVYSRDHSLALVLSRVASGYEGNEERETGTDPVVRVMGRENGLSHPCPTRVPSTD